MKVLVAGAGLMAKAVVYDLAQDSSITEITVIDIDKENLAQCQALSPKVKTQVVDVTKEGMLEQAIKGHDIVAGSLLHKFSPSLVQACINSKVDLVDLVGSRPDLKMSFHQGALDAGVTIIPGLGVAPGLSNVLAGVGLNAVDEPELLKISVGGIPKYPEPPLNYRVVYALESVLNASARKAKVIRSGKVVEVDPLTEVEGISFDEVGDLESFVTDGLSTLMITIPKDYPNIGEAVEKTVRYPGYAEKLKFLADCGLFNDQEITIDDVKVIPRKVLEASLRPILTRGRDEDVTVMRVEVVGKSKESGKRVRITYDLVDFFDEETKTTSMARTTGYSCAIGCRMVLKGLLPKGVIPAEYAFGGELYPKLKRELSLRNINIVEKVEVID